MPDSNSNSYHIKWFSNIEAISQQDWDALAVPMRTPLLEWQWLREMEASGSIAPVNGWYPRHLTIWHRRQLVAAAPLYIKTHSAGEFVFDHIWAQVARALDIPYYPKLVGMSPVTPAVGYRFLVARQEAAVHLYAMIDGAIRDLVRHEQLTGCHLLFVDPQWAKLINTNGWTAWHHQSYAWHNPGHENMDGYLVDFKSSQRRNIRREIKSMKNQGIRLAPIASEDLTSELAAVLYRYYANTNDQFGPWGCKYLTRRFFEGIFRRYRHRLLLIGAAKRGESTAAPLALSLLLRKNDQLIGRYWGCRTHVKDLHFNACYYYPIRWAIAHGITDFDPGAGSPHKIRRGFRAVANISLHRFVDARLQAVMNRHIEEINQMNRESIDELNAALPFHQPSVN